MSVELPLSAVSTSTSAETPFPGAPYATRQSLARKRRAVLPPIPPSPSNLTPRVPSSLSLSSDLSADSSSDDDSQSVDSVKRSRHDSSISVSTVSSDDGVDSSSQLSSQSSFLSSSPDVDSCSCGCGSTTQAHISRRTQYLVNESVIGNYKIVGAGREAKAVHLETDEVFDARVLTESEFEIVQRVVDRLDDARKFYRKADINEMREAVLPSSVEVIEETSGRLVMFSPSYQKTLHSFAQERSVMISESEILPLFLEILRMLAFCHTIGIIVRDIKPKKLVFDKFGRLRLSHVCDCWVCPPNDDFMQEKCGSPAYVPPEVVASCSLPAGDGRGYSGKAADMWGMGVMLYLLFFGRYPFYDQTPRKVFQKIMQARVVIPSNAAISKHARLVLLNLLRKAADERPTAEQLLAIPWGQPRTQPSRGVPLYERPGRSAQLRSESMQLMSMTSQDGRSAVSSVSMLNSEDDSRPSSRSSVHSNPVEELQAIVSAARRMLSRINPPIQTQNRC